MRFITFIHNGRKKACPARNEGLMMAYLLSKNPPTELKPIEVNSMSQLDDFEVIDLLTKEELAELGDEPKNVGKW